MDNATLLNTLSSRFLPALSFDLESFFRKVVVPSGYPYFEWNGRVYSVNPERTRAFSTSVLYEDLQFPASSPT